MNIQLVFEYVLYTGGELSKHQHTNMNTTWTFPHELLREIENKYENAYDEYYNEGRGKVQQGKGRRTQLLRGTREDFIDERTLER